MVRTKFFRETAIYNKYKDLFDEIVAIYKESEDLTSKSKGILFSEFSHQQLAFSLILARSQKLLISILYLCSEGHGEDGAVLIRILYENWIQMRFVRKNNLAKQFLEYSIITQKRYLDVLEKSFPELGTSKTPEYKKKKSKIDELYKSMAGHFLNDGGKLRSRWSLSLKDMVINLDKGEEIDVSNKKSKKRSNIEELLYERTMRHLSTFTHCDSLSLNNFILDNENTISFDNRPSEKEVDHVLIRARVFFSKINSEWANAFAFDTPELIFKWSKIKSKEL